MKWIYAFATIALFATSAFAYDVNEEEAGEARLGYISVASDGATSLTFNATSIQNAVILGLFLLVLGALILPLFGEAAADTESSYGYGEDQSGYQEPAAGYQGYAKRSLFNHLGPVMEALSATHKKYDEEE